MSFQQTPDAPSDRLLRTLAAVPVSSSVLDLGCGAGRHVEALLRLGFPIHACDPRPAAIRDARTRVRALVDDETAQSCVQQRSLEALDALEETFDWIIADRTEAYLDAAADLQALLKKSHVLLEPGGWLYLTVPAAPEEQDPDGPASLPSFSTSDLEVESLDVDLAASRSPARVEEHGESRVHAVYRRVQAQAPA